MNKQSLEGLEIGTVLTYLGTDPNENSAKCLVKGKGYEVIDKVTGFEALLSGIPSGSLVIKDESAEGYWAIHEDNIEHFEVKQ